MNNNSSVMVIGLTGQSGSGKTTVCEVFRENGFAIINADTIARRVMKTGSKCLREVAEYFSEDKIILEDGSLNRSKLANIIFTNSKKLQLLNSITYPHITEEILSEIEKLSESGEIFILIDAPTLFESHADDFCDVVISVLTSEENRIERIMKRDNITREQAYNRIHSQQEDSFYMNNSDYIIKNNKGVDILREKALDVSNKIKEYYNAKKAE